MSMPYPREFRADVVRVVLARVAGVSLARIVKDFGVAKLVLHRWIEQADGGRGVAPVGSWLS
jgi:transposase